MGTISKKKKQNRPRKTGAETVSLSLAHGRKYGDAEITALCVAGFVRAVPDSRLCRNYGSEYPCLAVPAPSVRCGIITADLKQMYPELLKLWGFSVSSYGVMVALAFLSAYLITSRELKRKGERPEMAEELLVWTVICSVAGAKLFFMAENFTLAEIAEDPLSTIFSRNGLTFYGGLLGGLAAGLYIARKNGAGLWKTLDATAPALALAYAIGRVGCLLVGDDYGVASDLPWAMAFPNGSPPVEFAVHPTQIYETLSMGAAFLILWKLREARKPDGWLFAIYLLLSGAERFLVEFIRMTTPSPIPGLSVAQVVALVLLFAGAVKLAAVSQKR